VRNSGSSESSAQKRRSGPGTTVADPGVVFGVPEGNIQQGMDQAMTESDIWYQPDIQRCLRNIGNMLEHLFYLRHRGFLSSGDIKRFYIPTRHHLAAFSAGFSTLIKAVRLHRELIGEIRPMRRQRSDHVVNRTIGDPPLQCLKFTAGMRLRQRL